PVPACNRWTHASARTPATAASACPDRTAWTDSSTPGSGSPYTSRHDCPRHTDVLGPGAAGTGRRAGLARSVAGRRATLRARGQAHGRKRRLAVPAPRQRAVCRQAAVVHVAAGGRVHRRRQLARRLPAAVAAGRAGHAVV